MWDRIAEAGKPVVIYGMGNGAEKIMNELERRGIKVSGVFANDEFVRGQDFRGFRVMTYAGAREKFGDMVVLLAFGTHIADVIGRIREIASEQELYAPDVPVCGNGIFDRDYASIWKDRIAEARGLLADEKSREVFDCVIEYKLTGNIEKLFECETPDDENWKLLGLNDRENYLDIGAYNGDTVRQFLSYVKGYGSITAMEPEKHSFRKLGDSLAGLENTRLLNMAVNDVKEEGLFSSGKGRGSSVGGGDSVMMDSVDGILDESRPFSFIKVDAEGQEAKAIDGARKTIEKYRPKMLVAAYHRVEDIFDIPLRVSKVYNGYNVFLRHTPCLPAWEVNYYFTEESSDGKS